MSNAVKKYKSRDVELTSEAGVMKKKIEDLSKDLSDAQTKIQSMNEKDKQNNGLLLHNRRNYK